MSAMAYADFVHLRVHSAYSLSEGALPLDRLVARCLEYGMPAVAVTDSCNLFGALEFAVTAAAKGVQPIVGCELHIGRADDTGDGGPAAERNGNRNGSRNGNGNGNGTSAGGRGGRAAGPDRLVLLVQSEAGYYNLMWLVSRAYLDGEPGAAPQLAAAALDGHTDGLIALTGGPAGTVGRLLLEGRASAAEAALQRLAGLFPGRLYVELMRHNLAEENRIEATLVDLAYRHDLPLVATNECYFADAAMYEAHDALLCIAEGAYVSQEGRRRVTPEHRLKSAAEMRALFADLPEAVDNALAIARRCHFMPTVRRPILPPYPRLNGRSEAEVLREMAVAGLERRLAADLFLPDMDAAARVAVAAPYRERLGYELDMILQMGFAGYFLIVADFIQWAKRQGIPVGPGRGSGAGSVVAWALTITDLDPIRWGLLFERFLNPERVSMPDFDVDFCQERRDEVLRYVQDAYGRDRVAQIITFGKLQARAVLRDVGRVLEMPYGQVDRLCKLVPSNPANPLTLAQAIEREPALQQARDEDETVARLIDVSLKLEGLFRHASTHAAGVVIGDRPLEQLIPLYRDPRADMTVTQFNMKFVEQAGLVKFDFLGLKTLTVLARVVALLRRRGIEIDLSRIPLDDRNTYEMLGRAETTGVFQMEGSGMRDVLRRLRPDRFEDLIAVVALYRPGPMDNIPSYIRRRRGEETPDYLHPSLQGILKETDGIIIYQEQVMQIAQTLAGYSLGGADLLRRAMGKKIKSEMDAQRETFVEGAVRRGVDRAKASHIFDLVGKFAGYGFVKSHAAAYALVAYQTAYFKANYPVEFLAASMSLDLANTDKLGVFRQELMACGVPLLGPDINRSGVDFTVEPIPGDGDRLAIRYALSAIKNVGRGAMEAVVREREANGPYRDLFDFAERLDTGVVNKRMLENLAYAGAFDALMANRRRVFESIDRLMRHAGAAAGERDSQQPSLFGEAMALEAPRPELPEAPDWALLERLGHEFEAIGFYLSAHPLDTYGNSLERLGVVRYADLAAATPGQRLAGIVTGKQERSSARGNRFAFVQLSDASGAYEVIVFAELLAAARDLLTPGRALLLEVGVQSADDGLRLNALQIDPLDEAVARTPGGLKVFVRTPDPLQTLKALLGRQGTGRGEVLLLLDLADREVEIKLPGGFALNAAVRAAIKTIPGVLDVHDA
jgi:DNA polymerase-3 subunit alpha